jgi:dihydroorotate dehydrogenase
MVADPDLGVDAFGLRFRNPVGLAAGFDKSARHARAMQHLGFGFLEIGSITARPERGNVRPRLFRLPRDGALVNRMGLNNEGADAIAERLESLRREIGIPLFGNVALTPGRGLDTRGAIEDYVTSVRRVRDVVDAIVLNVSCPNTGDGRTFEEPQLLRQLLGKVREAAPRGERPVIVKLSTDLEMAAFIESVEVVCEMADGLSLSNTTLDRSALRTDIETIARIGPGGVSGRPLFARGVEAVRMAARCARGRCPIVGVGGISRAQDARAYLDAGATLVQLYTGLVYEGPLAVRRICRGLGRDRRAMAATRPPRAQDARREA